MLHFLCQRELGKPERQRQVWETLTYDQYELGRLDLLATVRGERRAYLDLVLPTAGQIWVMAGRDWNMALRLARLPEPQQIQRRAAALFTLADHFYNARRQIPASYTELRDAYLALGIAVARHPGAWQRFLIEWRADRADRGLNTPASGPLPEQQLSAAELDDLLAGATRYQPEGSWTPRWLIGNSRRPSP